MCQPAGRKAVQCLIVSHAEWNRRIIRLRLSSKVRLRCQVRYRARIRCRVGFSSDWSPNIMTRANSKREASVTKRSC